MAPAEPPEIRRDSVLDGEARAVLAKLEHMVAVRPRQASAAMADIVIGATSLRDGLIARQRAGKASAGEADWLRCANALLSLLVGAEYPVTGFHWEDVCTARDALRTMLDAG